MFRVWAMVRTTDSTSVRAHLAVLLGAAAAFEMTPEGLSARGSIVGVEARELNRRLLATVRAADPRARVHAAWTTPGGETAAFRDYVFLKPRHE